MENSTSACSRRMSEDGQRSVNACPKITEHGNGGDAISETGEIRWPSAQDGTADFQGFGFQFEEAASVGDPA